MKLGRKFYLFMFLAFISTVVGGYFYNNLSVVKANEDEYGIDVSYLADSQKTVNLTFGKLEDEEVYLQSEGLQTITKRCLQMELPLTLMEK
ncbi:hypothetical protein [uncultured Enterococcus sp.]|uniref:hypothetical protein n=1 Tax=uncultured Enterococcus sp. TaxID=167972 RepID=UPI002AA88F19|nr:hypothetical protein [uncultured Enterococcus sp.]